MIGRRTIIGISLACAMLVCAVAAHGAIAAGQTIRECSKSAVGKTFSDAHCDSEVVSGGSFGTVEFPTTPTAITITNGATKNATTEATIATLKIAKLHGLANVVVECTEVSGTGEAANSETAGVMKGSGVGTIGFHSGGGGNCTTNQTGCTVKVAAVGAKAESIQPSGAEMGLKFEPSGTNFTTVTFEGSCGLATFGAIPIKGSTIGTADGEANGHGATTWFIEGSMNAITVGGEPAQLIGKATLKSASGNALALSTSEISPAGPTLFECSKSAATKGFADAHCDKAGGSEYGHAEFPKTATEVTATNAGTAEETKSPTLWTTTVSKLHGFSNVVVECTEVHAFGTARNSEIGAGLSGSGEGTAAFESAGGNCTTNQTGCTVRVVGVGARAETVQLSGTELGVIFQPTGTNFTSATFEGTCGLAAFGAIPVKGSAIATAGGEPGGHGATAWFTEGSMNSVTVGGESAQVTGKLQFKRSSTGNPLVLTTR